MDFSGNVKNRLNSFVQRVSVRWESKMDFCQKLTSRPSTEDQRQDGWPAVAERSEIEITGGLVIWSLQPQGLCSVLRLFSYAVLPVQGCHGERKHSPSFA